MTENWRIEDGGLEHEPGGRILQGAADLRGEVVHVSPLGMVTPLESNVLLSA